MMTDPEIGGMWLQAGNTHRELPATGGSRGGRVSEESLFRASNTLISDFWPGDQRKGF